MKRFFGFLALLCLFFGAGAQVKNNINKGLRAVSPSALGVGDRLPVTGSLKVLNNGGRPLRLDAFRGKLLILDFWATSCGGCIQGMPVLDSLQRVFGDELAVIPVTYEKAAEVGRFQANNAFLIRAGVAGFRTVVEDKALHAMFPHRLLPHEVWIGRDGTVLGFTDGVDVTAGNIRAVLAGKPFPVRGKKDVLDFDKSKLLMVNNNGAPDSAFRYRSIFSAEIRGINSGLELSGDTVRGLVHVRATNVDARYLYTLAFKQLRGLARGQVDVGIRPGLFCYEMTMPLAPAAAVRRAVREDLDRYLGVRSVMDGTGFRLEAVREVDDSGEPLSL